MSDHIFDPGASGYCQAPNCQQLAEYCTGTKPAPSTVGGKLRRRTIANEPPELPPVPATEVPAGAHDPMRGEPLTELGYARRLIKVYGGELRYVPHWRSWLIWDGRR